MASTINASTTSGIIQTADTSGALSLQASNTTIAALTTAGAAITGNLSATGNLTVSGTTTLSSSVITSGTAKLYSAFTTTSYNDFTGIPSWVKRITIMGAGVVAGGNNALRLGTSGGIVSTGYTSAGNNFTASATGGDNNTTYFYVRSTAFNGKMVLDLLSASTNTWTYQGTSCEASGTTGTILGSGVVSLASTLTQVRFLSSTGTFSAGTINISYE